MPNPPTRKPTTVYARASAAALACLAMLTGCVQQSDDATKRAPSGQHKIDVPLATAAEKIRVTIPPTATDTKWAYIQGFQDDVILISFRMNADGLEAYLTDNHVDLPLGDGTRAGMLSFAQHGAGLDPETVSGGHNSSRQPVGYVWVGVSVGPTENGTVQVWLSGYN